MKKSVFFISLYALSLISFLSLRAQKIRISPELIILTKDGTGNYTFQMTSTSSIIWEAHLPGEDSVYITTATKYVDPGDITIPGDGTVTNKGWNADKYPSEDPQYGPLLGRGYYRITVDRTGDTLAVDCYGTNFPGDVIVV